MHRRIPSLPFAVALAVLSSWSTFGQAPAQAPATDLDAFMARALQRRDIDRQTLSDYVLDEVESFEILGPGKAPIDRMRREYTWYVRDGIHVRSPLRFDGVPISEADRRAYEERWFHSEQERRKFRAERAAKREAEGRPRPINEPRFVAESYFLDFRFEPGNYYLAGHESLDGHDVARIEYYPTHLFRGDKGRNRKAGDKEKDPAPPEKPRTAKEAAQDQKDRKEEEDITRKMNKTALVTLWVDPDLHQIVKYTFDNVWLDFLPGGWLVRVDDLRASMEMGQPFKGVWLPRNISIRGGLTMANGSYEAAYRRDFSNFRRADVSSRIRIKHPEVR